MARHFLPLLVALFCVIASRNAQSEIILVEPGYFESRYVVRVCNETKRVAELAPITRGKFLKANPIIGPNQCQVLDYWSSESSHVIKVDFGEKIELMTVLISKDGFFTQSFVNSILLVLLGFFAASFQEISRDTIGLPARAIKLWWTYRSNVLSLQRNVDDANKRYRISDELVNIVSGSDQSYYWLTKTRLMKISDLVRAYEAWKAEQVVSAETRRTISRLDIR